MTRKEKKKSGGGVKRVKRAGEKVTKGRGREGGKGRGGVRHLLVQRFAAAARTQGRR